MTQEQEENELPNLEVDLNSLSPENLVALIQQLEHSQHLEIRKRAQKELVRRLRGKEFSHQRIAGLLTTNVYGVAKKREIADEWAHALDLTPTQFMRLIGK